MNLPIACRVWEVANISSWTETDSAGVARGVKKEMKQVNCQLIKYMNLYEYIYMNIYETYYEMS